MIALAANVQGRSAVTNTDYKRPEHSTGDATAARRLKRRHALFWLVAGIAVVGVLALVSLPLIAFFGDPERVAAWIDDAGPWAPLVFIGIQIAQVFAAPIPGQVTGFVGGFLFGGTLGSLYAIIGGTLGCALVFALSRRLGRPFVERFVRPAILERFDYIIGHNGVAVLLIIFLVPIFPDDLICYIAGLTRIPLRRLVLVALVGRTPAYVLFSLTGAGAAQSNTTLIVIVVAALVMTAGIAFWQRHRIEAFLKRLASGHGHGSSA